MTEKHYGGSSSFQLKEKPAQKKADIIKKEEASSKKSPIQTKEETQIDSQDKIEKLKKAGAILKVVMAHAKSIIKKDSSLLEIAESIEKKIQESGAMPAFPVNLSINEIAAHSTPFPNEQTLAHGLLKVDIGVQIDGNVADAAFSIDLENSEQNKQLIKATEDALESAIKIISTETTLSEIGSAIETAIKLNNSIPIQNLSGHSIEEYELHSGVTIPNYNNSSNIKVPEGLYAIEPFATLTTASGSVRDGKPSGIYSIKREGNVRDSFARQVLDFIIENYKTLPFCQRWIHKQFGSRSLLALRQIEQAGLLHQYPQLIEKSNSKVAQAEHTILLTKNEKILITK